MHFQHNCTCSTYWGGKNIMVLMALSGEDQQHHNISNIATCALFISSLRAVINLLFI